MSQKPLPRRVDFPPTSDAPTQAPPYEIVLITGESGLLVDSGSGTESGAQVTTLIESPRDPDKHAQCTFTVGVRVDSRPRHVFEALGCNPWDRLRQDRILVVDDEPAVRETIRRLLHGAGFHVVAVDGGAAALTTLQHDPTIGLVLLDVEMPVWTGSRFAARNSRTSGWPRSQL